MAAVDFQNAHSTMASYWRPMREEQVRFLRSWQLPQLCTTLGEDCRALTEVSAVLNPRRPGPLPPACTLCARRKSNPGHKHGGLV